MSISDMGAAPEIYAAQNTKLTPFMRQIFFVRLWINYGLVLSVLILGGVSNSVLAQPTSCYIHVSFVEMEIYQSRYWEKLMLITLRAHPPMSGAVGREPRITLIGVVTISPGLI